MIIFSTFGLSIILLIISLSLKTVMLSLRVALKAAEVSMKAAGKVASKVAQADSTGTISGVANTAGKAVDTVKKTGKAATNTVKTTVKAAKTTYKVGKTAVKMSIKAMKLAIRAIRVIINVLHTIITFLLSLGIVGIVILIVVALFLVAAIAGALLSAPMMFGDSGLTGVFGTGGSNGMTITNPSMTTPGSGSSTVVVTPGNTQQLVQACQTMANWYFQNVSTYAGGTDNKIHYVKWYTCDIMPFGSMQVGDECGRFAAAYASYVSGQKIVNEGSCRAIYNGSAQWESAGWKYYTTTDIGGVAGLQPGDVMICSSNADPLSVGGHAEVYLGPGQSFGWGKIQSKFPSNTTQLTDVIKTDSNGNELIYIAAGSSHHYGRIYRYVGGS